MINPVSVIKMLNDRKNFVNNHPDFIGFILDTFGDEMAEGDRIKIQIEKKNGKIDEMGIQLEDTDIVLFEELKKIVKQIRS